MCLVTNNNITLVAEKDIMAYKILCYWRDSNRWRTPWTETDVPSDGVLDTTDQLSTFMEREINTETDERRYYFDIGWIHGLRTKADAEKALRQFRRVATVSDIETRIIPCVIPKGTRYVVGTNLEENRKEFCAKKVFVDPRNLAYEEQNILDACSHGDPIHEKIL